MLLRPTRAELKAIVYFLSRITEGLAALFLIPAVIAVLFQEWKPCLDFLFSAALAYAVSGVLARFGERREMSGPIVAAVVPSFWLLAAVLSGVPLYLSGHFGSYLDAVFDAMSAFSTTGLTLILDLDHLAMSTNFFRHLKIFVGGQGIILAALLFPAAGLREAYRLYSGEGREEKIFPNVRQTALFIWSVSIIYLLIGTVALALSAWRSGMSPGNAVFQGINLFMAAFDTGGFTPQSMSVMFYQSALLEAVLAFVMIAGMINFGLHFALWSGNLREIYRDIEVKSLTVTILFTFTGVALALVVGGVFETFSGVFRKGFFQLISAHSTTGHMTVYAEQLGQRWGDFALVALSVAMGLGGGACSTAGGIKALRVGLSAKIVLEEVKKTMLPQVSVVRERYHHLRDFVIQGGLVRNVLLVILAYLVTYLLGAMVCLYYGYSFTDSLFESISAAANVGLSTGLTAPTMPALIKVVFILQMWAGRLEFVSVMALLALLAAVVRGR